MTDPASDAYRSPCPENVRRASMTDDEFWSDVFPEIGGDEIPDPPAVTPYDTPCPVCGATSPCAYDPNGFPLIHDNQESL